MSRKVVLSNISVYSLTHALVDAACAATLFAIVTLGGHDAQVMFYMIVFYDVLAFATQSLFGLAVDAYDVPVYAAVAGALLVAGATLLLPFPFLAAMVSGLGNALFHVGGGVISLNLEPGRATLPGVYVAPGALGLTLGTLIGKGGSFVAWPFILLSGVAAALMLSVPRPRAGVPRTLPRDLRWFEVVILLLLISIGIRGIVGLSLDLPWKSDPLLLLTLTSAVVLGKALGGVAGDKYGWNKVALSGLVLAAPLLTLFGHVPGLAILGAFCFNLTMPITLTCLVQMLPGKSGFAFGLTTLALVVGAVPTFTPLRDVTSHPLFISAAILVAIVALYAGLRLYSRHFARELS